MKKIMFNDKYGLTEAVLEGRKTQTRRIVPTYLRNAADWKYFEEGHNDCLIDPENPFVTDICLCGRYAIGEEVAIAQRYSECFRAVCLENSEGWNNKMFVKADLMPHRIKITNIRVEHLQDISDEDCLKEGIGHHVMPGYEYYMTLIFNGKPFNYYYPTPKEAFEALIDKVSGKGTWKSNPYVFVYDFELVK